MEWRADHLSDAADADRRIRQGQGRRQTRYRHDRRRGDPERMPGSPADGVVRRRLDREPADDDLELDRARGERILLPAWRPFRLAFIQREHGPGVLRED